MAAAWSRVFGLLDLNPDPARLEQAALEIIPKAAVHLKGDDRGWFCAEISWGQGSPLTIETYAATDPEVRADLNTWAAYIETCDYSPNAHSTMVKVALSQQIITLRRPIDHADESGLDRLMHGMAQHLALEIDGIFQIDEAGFFDKNGTLLVEEF